MNKHIQKLNDLQEEITVKNIYEICRLDWLEEDRANDSVQLDGYYDLEDLEALVIAMKEQIRKVKN